MSAKVLILGAGEHASATGHRLFRCGLRVVMTDLATPMAVRRAVSFCSAITDGEVTVEGVRGVRHELDRAGDLAGFDWSHVPVFVDPSSSLKACWRPDVIVDGRLLKASSGSFMAHAPLTIALGPGPVAGRDVHFVVETQRGHDLGRIIDDGEAAKDTGEPGDIGGFTHQRVLRAPAGGRFQGVLRIGATVAAGDVVGRVGAEQVVARIAGVLRGLATSGLEVGAGQKLGDIDPRGVVRFASTISDKARTISGSVLEIVDGFLRRPA
jgi:xanthine dehydrogenase accessory factor